MHGVLTIMLASVFAVKASQLSIIADKNNVKDGERVVLTCTVPDFSDNLFVKQNSINKAVCIGSDPCTASNSEHNASRSGSTNVIFTILSFSKIRDEGQWLISYGNTESTPITLSAFTESSSASGNVSDGTIAGIAVGCFIVMAITIFLIWKYCPRGHGPPIPPHHPHPAQPTDKSSTQEAIIGSKVVLLPQLCNLDHLVHSVKWLQNDKPVSTGEDCAYKGGNTNRPSLEISSVSNEDFGQWKCILESENSKQIFVVQLTNGSGHSKLGKLPPLGK